MASFNKTFPVPGQAADKIYKVLATDIDKFIAKTPLTNVEIQRNEATKQVSFKSSMASGTITAKEGSVSVDISLSFIASAFKGKIDEGVTKWLSKTFGKA
jgi:hypothetical protein